MERKKLIRKERLRDASDILNSIVFLAGAYDFWDQNKIWMAVILFFAGMINLTITEIFKTNRIKVKLVMMAANCLIAGFIAYNYLQEGKYYIQYAWMIVALIYLVFTIRLLMKHSKMEEELSKPPSES